jgi:diaminohydroxyphosphoribosylaminopyrimidine deaminase/5-amino-6-(5-phosphoribosylamino)uracil reductase
VLADDPSLTCRLPGMEARSPVRVVLDRALRIPGESKLVHSARQTPLWVIAAETAEAPAATILGAAGAQVIRIAPTSAPGLDLPAVLHALAEKGITRLMVEGGGGPGRRNLAVARTGYDRRRRCSRAGRIAAYRDHAVADVQGPC